MTRFEAKHLILSLFPKCSLKTIAQGGTDYDLEPFLAHGFKKFEYLHKGSAYDSFDCVFTFDQSIIEIWAYSMYVKQGGLLITHRIADLPGYGFIKIHDGEMKVYKKK